MLPFPAFGLSCIWGIASPLYDYIIILRNDIQLTGMPILRNDICQFCILRNDIVGDIIKLQWEGRRKYKKPPGKEKIYGRSTKGKQSTTESTK